MDNKWHRQLPAGIGRGTVSRCKQFAMIETKEGEKLFRISKKGRIIYLEYQSGKTGEISDELRKCQLTKLRKMLGQHAVRSLQKGTAIFKIWRRSQPHNWWVESNNGSFLWHSTENNPRPSISTYFDLVKNSSERIVTGHREIIGFDEGAHELSVYKLKSVYS